MVPTAIAASPGVTLVQEDAFETSALDKFVSGLDVVICGNLGDGNLMDDGQKALIDPCERAGVKRYIASDWCLDYTKLMLGELFPKDPMIHIHASLETKRLTKSVRILVGSFVDAIFSPFFDVFDTQSNTIKYWDLGRHLVRQCSGVHGRYCLQPVRSRDSAE